MSVRSPAGEFKLEARCGSARAGTLRLRHGDVPTPCFMPVGTIGTVKFLTPEDLRAAIDATLAGQSVKAQQQPSVGCNIKWKKGSEPVYYR